MEHFNVDLAESLLNCLMYRDEPSEREASRLVFESILDDTAEALCKKLKRFVEIMEYLQTCTQEVSDKAKTDGITFEEKDYVYPDPYLAYEKYVRKDDNETDGLYDDEDDGLYADEDELESSLYMHAMAGVAHKPGFTKYYPGDEFVDWVRSGKTFSEFFIKKDDNAD